MSKNTVKASQCRNLGPQGLRCQLEEGHGKRHVAYNDLSESTYGWDDQLGSSTTYAKGVTVPNDEPKSVLDEAKSIVAGARATEYGEGAENSLPRIASYWSTYLGRELSARDAANMMVLLKMARESHKPKRDNHVDAIGYLALAEQCDGSQSGL